MCHLGWEPLSLLHTQCALLCSAGPVHHTAPGQPQYCVCLLQGGGGPFVAAQEECIQADQSTLAAGRDLMTTEGLCTLLQLILLPLIYGSKTCSTHCLTAVFSWRLWYLESVDRSVLTSTLPNRQQMTLAHYLSPWGLICTAFLCCSFYGVCPSSMHISLPGPFPH